MNKLEKLIKDICPNGVKYQKVGDIAVYEQPSKYIVESTKYNDDYEIPVLTAGQTFILGYTNETQEVYNASKDDPVIIFDDFTGAFKWVDFPFKVKSSAMKIIKSKTKNYILRYIYHLMGFINYSSNEHKRLWIGIYSEFLVPVPPLPVQAEIVRILDNFTELTAELTAELMARKKQYEYYINTILSFPNSIPSQKLGDTCDMKAGKSISSAEISSVKTNNDIYPCFGGNGIRGYVDKFSHDGDFPIVGRQGALCGNIKFASGKFYATEHAVVVKSKGAYNHRFLFYLLLSMDLNQYKSQGAQPGLSVKTLENLWAPVPPLKEQERIASILDRFDKLCNDISEGLPAEIAARQKQYEYYRDKLLTFKVKE